MELGAKPFTSNVVLVPHTAVGEAVWCGGLAKLYRKLGYKVFVADNCQLKSNPEAYELFFQKNPYISGEKTIDPDDILDGVITERNPFRRIVLNPGLLKVGDFSQDERQLEIHYHPMRRVEMKGVTLLDLNISSYRLVPGGRDNFGKVEKYVLENYPDAVTIVREKYDVVERSFELLPVASHYPAVGYRTIYEYCDLVFSCDKVVCLQTGSEPLACHYNGKVDCLRTEAYNANPASRNRLMFINCEVNDIDLQ